MQGLGKINGINYLSDILQATSRQNSFKNKVLCGLVKVLAEQQARPAT
jgi:hypothetical protein